jgi:dTDP-4-dehydrorhamnose reductase
LGRSPQIAPIRTSEYPTLALRAADTRLDCTAIMREFGVKPRPWRQALEDTIDRLLSNKDMP